MDYVIGAIAGLAIGCLIGYLKNIFIWKGYVSKDSGPGYSVRIEELSAVQLDSVYNSAGDRHGSDEHYYCGKTQVNNYKSRRGAAPEGRKRS